MKMLKTIECSEELQLLFFRPLFCWSSWMFVFTLAVNFTDGSPMSGDLVVIVGSTMASPFG
jgi:hypothetical protein